MHNAMICEYDDEPKEERIVWLMTSFVLAMQDQERVAIICQVEMHA